MKMPDPALKAADQARAAGRGGGLENTGDLVTQRLCVRPEFLGLGFDCATQGLDYRTLQPFGPNQRHRQCCQTGRSQHIIDRACRAAQNEKRAIGDDLVTPTARWGRRDLTREVMLALRMGCRRATLLEAGSSIFVREMARHYPPLLVGLYSQCYASRTQGQAWNAARCW